LAAATTPGPVSHNTPREPSAGDNYLDNHRNELFGAS